MVKYNRYNGAIFDRRMLSKWFGKKNKRPDDECWELEWFIRNTLCGSDWEVKCWGDICDWNQKYGTDYLKRLPEWYAEHKASGSWPVIETQDDETVWAYFSGGTKVKDSDWAPVVFIPDCPFLNR